MAILNVNGTDYKGKVSFDFETMADEKYSGETDKANQSGGLMKIYMNLLDDSNLYLLAFWDCSFAHLKGKERPTVNEIKTALEEYIEKHGDTQELFKVAFKAIDEAGFTKGKVTKFWKRLDKMKATGKTEEEKKANEEAYNQMAENRAELLA